MTLAIAQGILLRVYQESGLTPDVLRSRRRHRHYVKARQAVMFALRKRTDWSLPRIARFLNIKDHTTVLHGLRTIEDDIERWPHIAAFTGHLMMAPPIVPLTLDTQIAAITPMPHRLRPAKSFYKAQRREALDLAEAADEPIVVKDLDTPPERTTVRTRSGMISGSAKLLIALEAAAARRANSQKRIAA